MPLFLCQLFASTSGKPVTELGPRETVANKTDRVPALTELLFRDSKLRKHGKG